MIRNLFILYCWLALCLPSLAHAQELKLTADSEKQEAVPTGEIKGPFEWKSQIFSGTVRKYWVYVPRQYKQETPACLMVVQDGLGRANGWRLPVVMDNLIHKKEIPVMLGVFIEPGVVPAPNENAQPRFNRSFEYDSMGDAYARFLIEEILPEVAKSYSLSDDPNDRAISGTAREPFVRSMSLGNDRMLSAACSVPSALTSVCTAPTNFRCSFARLNRNRFASFCRTAATT